MSSEYNKKIPFSLQCIRGTTDVSLVVNRHWAACYAFMLYHPDFYNHLDRKTSEINQNEKRNRDSPPSNRFILQRLCLNQEGKVLLFPYISSQPFN